MVELRKITIQDPIHDPVLEHLKVLVIKDGSTIRDIENVKLISSLEILEVGRLFETAFLKEMIFLKQLKLTDCGIFQDCSDIGNLINLEQLHIVALIDDNDLRKLLTNFKKLKKLYISESSVTDLQPVSLLTNLVELTIESSEQLKNDTIIFLTKLTKLSLNPMPRTGTSADLQFLSHNTQLKELSLVSEYNFDH
eukprot:Pgem_evm1s8319